MLVLTRWARRLLVGLALALGATYLWLQVRQASLAGVRIEGVDFPATDDVRAALSARADAYLGASVRLQAGAIASQHTRRALGASRDVQQLAARIEQLGRTGNPLRDLTDFWRAHHAGFDFAWPVAIDRNQLATVIRTISHQVDQPPMAGTVGEGWSMEGVPGLTLGVLDAVATIESALRQGQRDVSLTVRQVPPPPPIELGAPDGADDEEQSAFQSSGTYADTESLRAYQPAVWMQSRGKECGLGRGFERFCQGPRRVAAPFGAEAERAKVLELGTFETVARLIVQPPRAEWVEAAGDHNADASLLYPVREGTLWRGFGFVRKGALREQLHKGIDIGAPIGTPIHAVNDGIVAYADNGVRGYGNLLVLIHGSGSVTSYAHCAAIYVFPGQRVRRGQVVGEVGDTGIARGAHLHFEYRRGGVPVDPADRLTAPAGEP